MLTCKQVSKALHEEGYHNLPFWRKFFLRLHVLICPFCGKFNTQLIKDQEMCRSFKDHEDQMIGEQPHLEDSK
ncbi:MAG: hypothetical protein HRT56_05780, partial [Coraliomargarita sp.]|nr:hypothetical protein [Coraliomargarita sp.]